MIWGWKRTASQSTSPSAWPSGGAIVCWPKERGQTNCTIVCRAHPFVLPPGWTFHSTSDAVSHQSVSLAGDRISFIPPPLDLFPIYSSVSRWGLFVRLFYFQKVPGCCRPLSSSMWAQTCELNLWAQTTCELKPGELKFYLWSSSSRMKAGSLIAFNFDFKKFSKNIIKFRLS